VKGAIFFDRARIREVFQSPSLADAEADQRMTEVD
jgi:hypothetical protein